MINLITMPAFLQLSLLLASLLLLAKLSGYVSIRLNQPSVLGELIVGILLGPSVLNFLHLPFFDEEIMMHFVVELGEIGVLLLMFIAGLELHLDELSGNLKVSALAGTMGVLLPFGLAWGGGLLLGMTSEAAAFLGLVLGATSVSISAQTLMELKMLKSRVGLSLLGAAVFDDVLVILFLAIFFAVISGATNTVGILLIFGRMLLFFALAAALGIWLLPRLVRVVRDLPISQNVLSLAVVTLFFYGLAAELIGHVAAITGAFLAGLMFARTPEKEILEPRISALAYGFFVPIFFVSIGLKTSLSLRGGAWGLILGILVIAIVGKWSGVLLGARAGRLSWRESIQLGAGMISRGEVGLIVANTGLNSNLLNAEELSAIVAMVIVTTLITPPILRWLFHLPPDWKPRWSSRRRLKEYNHE